MENIFHVDFQRKKIDKMFHHSSSICASGWVTQLVNVLLVLIIDFSLFYFFPICVGSIPSCGEASKYTLSQEGWTNLHYAALGGNTDHVHALIAAKSNVEAKDKVYDMLDCAG